MKGQASQEAAWWFSEVCITTHQKPLEVVKDHRLKEVRVDQGKHLCPRTLPGTYLGFSNAPSTIKGQKVWLPELNCIVIAKDVRFSKLEQSETNTIPSHAPILARNSKAPPLLHLAPST